MELYRGDVEGVIVMSPGGELVGLWNKDGVGVAL